MCEYTRSIRCQRPFLTLIVLLSSAESKFNTCSILRPGLILRVSASGIFHNGMLIFPGESYNIEAWTGAEAFVMIVCGNVPPLKPLWDRFVTKKVDSNYAPINYSMKNYHSKLSGTVKASSSGENTHTLLSQHENWSQNGPQMNDPGFKAVTDIHVVRYTDMV